MSKTFYLGSYIGATVLIFILVIVAIVVAVVVPNVENLQAYAIVGLVFFFILIIVVAIYITVVMAIMFYKMWDAINDEEMPIHPVLAVVLLLIPIVSFFWMLAAYPLFLKYYNEYIERRAGEVQALKPGLFYAYPALLVVYIICSIIAQIAPFIPGSTLPLLIALPFSLVAMAASLASFVVFLILVAKICDAVNVLPQPTMDGMVRSAR
jgi:hypothetical protein